MATPNINDSSKNITGYHQGLALTTTEQTLLNNAAGSGKLMRVAGIYMSNVDGSSPATVTAKVYNQDDLGGTGFHLAYDMPVAAQTTLLIIDKNAPIYLREDQSIGIVASAASDLEAIIVYEEIS